MKILEVKNLKKSFGKTEVLKGVSFSIEKGEVLTVLGSSGSGKTTLLRCLNFLESPGSGEIFVGEKEIYSSNAKNKLTDKEIRERRLNFGLVFQLFNLFPQYTVLKNLTLAAKLREKEGPFKRLSKTANAVPSVPNISKCAFWWCFRFLFKSSNSVISINEPTLQILSKHPLA